jgi:hypothetical protein
VLFLYHWKSRKYHSVAASAMMQCNLNP